MAGDERPVDPKPDPLEERLRGRLRLVAGLTFLGLIVVLALADTFGRSADLHVSEFVFGSLVGAFLLVAGVEAGARFFGNGKR
jgi:hypothetical protein